MPEYAYHSQPALCRKSQWFAGASLEHVACPLMDRHDSGSLCCMVFWWVKQVMFLLPVLLNEQYLTGKVQKPGSNSWRKVDRPANTELVWLHKNLHENKKLAFGLRLSWTNCCSWFSMSPVPPVFIRAISKSSLRSKRSIGSQTATTSALMQYSSRVQLNEIPRLGRWFGKPRTLRHSETSWIQTTRRLGMFASKCSRSS